MVDLPSAHGVVVSVDVTDKQSMQIAAKFIKDVQNYVPDVPMIVVGTKCDLIDQKAITYEQGKEFAQTYDFQYFETSSKTGAGVQEAFIPLFEQIVERFR